MKAVRRGLGSAFASLSVRNFRLFFVGQAVSISGTFMQMVAQAWLVLNLTGSAAALGLVTACQFLPTLLVGPYAGVVADRVDKRRLLVATQLVSLVLAVVLGVLVAAGSAQLWMVMGLAAALGLVGAFDGPARQSFVQDMVGQDRLTNALSLNTTTINVGRLLGPAVAGLLIARWSLAACFLANAASYVVGIGALLAMRTGELEQVPRVGRARGQLREGLRYVCSRPGLLVPLGLMLLVGTFTYEFTVTLPVLARDTFDVGAAGYGAMQTVMSVGAIVGGLTYATRANPTHRTLALVSCGFGAAMLGLAVSPTYGAALAVLVLVGATSTLFMTAVNASLQLDSAPEMRSRVMALYSVAFVGSTPVGGPVIGWVTERFGVGTALAIGGVAALLGAGVVALVLRRHTEATPEAPVLPLVDDLLTEERLAA